MGDIKTLGRYAYRKYVTDGVSASGFNKVGLGAGSDVYKFVDKTDEKVEDHESRLSTLETAGVTSTYKGTWDASANSPTIPAAATGNTGWYYRVSTAGTTTVDGISSWAVGDIIVSDGTAWDKVAAATGLSDLISEVDAARGSEDSLSDALALKADTSTVTALSDALALKADATTVSTLSDEVDLKAPLDSPVFTGSPAAPDPTANTGLANKRYVDTALAALGFSGFFDNGDDLPDPANYSIGDRITIADGDDMILCVRSKFGYWQPSQKFRPTWLPDDADYGASWDRARYYRDGVGYLPLSYIISTDRTGDGWARKANGYWQKFGTGEIRRTDLGLWSETSAANARNFLRHGNDMRINVSVQMVGGNGQDFEDDELVTWTGGGSGHLVLDQSDVVNHIYAFRDAAGAFTGTATGATSGATRAAPTNTYSAWTLAGVTVTLDGKGFDETEDKGNLIEFTTNGGTISQEIMTTAFASPQTTDTDYNYNLSIQRVSGTGTVSASMDDGATYTDLDFDADGIAWVQCPAAKLYSSGATVKLRGAVSGDKVRVTTNQFEAKATRSSYIPTTWNSAARGEDAYVAPIDAFQTLLTSGLFSIVMRVQTMEANTGAFFQIDDNADRSQSADLADNRYRHDFAYKSDREDPPGTPAPGIEVGITCGVDGSTTAGIDPVGYLLPVDEEAWLGWSLDFANLTIVSAGGGIATTSVRSSGELADPADFESIRWGSDCGGRAPQNGYMRTWVGWIGAKDEAALEALTGENTTIMLP